MCDAKVVQGRMASRQGSSASMGGCGRSASRSSSRASNSLPVPACMQPPSNVCYNHPRPDCCRIPCCKPPLPKCPLGVYVERVQPFLPDRSYQPPTFPMEGMSSYREQYHLKCGERVKSLKPLSTFDPSCAQMDGLSSYREAYTPKPLCPYQKPPWAKQNQFEPSCAKIDGLSTYRHDYKGCYYPKVQSLKPNSDFDPSCAKMDGITTYRFNYIPYCPREYQYAKLPSMKKDMTPSFSCAPMEGCTTYRADFFPKCPTKRQSMKPNSKARFSDAKFADRTTYRNDYFPFHFEKCVGQCIPAQVYDEMFPACGIMACGAEPEPPAEGGYQEPCPPNPGCCPGGAIRQPGSCGNEFGLFPGPLPECCQPDPVPIDEGGDC